MKLQTILMPVMEFDHAEKGDALYCKLHLKLQSNKSLSPLLHITLEYRLPI